MMFIFDIFVPLLSWKRFIGLKTGPSDIKAPLQNFGKRAAGFRVDDPKLCSESAQRVLDLDAETVVFAHGDLDSGAIRKGKDDVKKVLEPLKTLLI
jgi:hypothetical protein